MHEPRRQDKQHFQAHETAREASLDGLPLATFWQRLLGYLIDLLLAVVIWAPLEFLWRRYILHEQNINLEWNFHDKGNIIVMLL